MVNALAFRTLAGDECALINGELRPTAKLHAAGLRPDPRLAGARPAHVEKVPPRTRQPVQPRDQQHITVRQPCDGPFDPGPVGLGAGGRLAERFVASGG
jgi:hypothetical protein